MKHIPEILITVSDAAARLGVTARALRFYERKGLVRPRRTRAGWRMYGRAELERLHLVVALKAMGFELSRIESLINDEAVDLQRVLGAQEKALAETLGRTSRALALVRVARTRTADGTALATSDLIDLTRETAAAAWISSPTLERLIDRHFSPAQHERVAALDWAPEEFAELSQRWSTLVARAEALLDRDPAAPEVLALARDWTAEIERFTRGDRGLEAAMQALYTEAFDQPEPPSDLPLSREVWEFMQAACDALEECGEGADGRAD